MGRVSDNAFGIDRHGDKDQPCKRRRAAAHHEKKVIPMIQHRIFLSSDFDALGVNLNEDIGTAFKAPVTVISIMVRAERAC